MERDANARILIVDDHEDNVELLRARLEAWGYRTDTAMDGASALRSVYESTPDLILLDVMMPGMDGPSTLKALRAMPETAATPAIFMTAKVQPDEIAAHKALGALDVIPKPFDPMALPDRIREIFARPR